MLALVLMTGAGRGAAPPATPGWVARELGRVQQIEARADQAALRGDFTQALRLAREALKARRVLQGERHWQIIDAVLLVEHWKRLARLSPEKQGQVGAALRRRAEGAEHRSKGRYRQAEKAFRVALDLCRQALGEGHPDTAHSYNNVAFCLHALGKAQEALPPVAGLIRYRRGELHILDRPRLEATSCGCHRTIEDYFAQLPG
jgi:tetratricopeptide (TPR) repeat protein